MCSSHATGQTRSALHHSFHMTLPLTPNQYTVHIAKRENPIVNRLNKTKVVREVDHEAERIERVKKENAIKRVAAAEKVRLPFPSLTVSALTLIITMHTSRRRPMPSLQRPERQRRRHDRTIRSSLSTMMRMMRDPRNR